MKHLILAQVLVAALVVVTSGGVIAGQDDTPWVYSTYLGSDSEDQGASVVLDTQGRAVVTGYTSGTSFPADAPAGAPLHGVDVFATRFSPDGSAADYVYWFNALTLFAEDEGYSVAVDAQGNAYVTGYTRSEDFCIVFGSVPGYHPTYYGETDAFVLKIRADGSGLAYCTFLGGADWDTGRAIAVDLLGNVYVVGGTWSTDFPTTPGAVQPALADLRDSFLVKLDSTGTQMLYSTFFGGSGQEESVGVQPGSVDGSAASDVYVAGFTTSADFPVTPGVIGPVYRGDGDGFLYKLDLAANRLVYATYLGGAGADRPAGLALRRDRPLIAGSTQSGDFPTTPGVLAGSPRGGQDGFVAQVAPDGRNLDFSTYLGGSADDWVSTVDLAGDGTVFVAGATDSADFPVTAGAVSTALAGERDAFLARLSSDGSRLFYSSYLGGHDMDQARSVMEDGSGGVVITGSTSSADFPTTPQAYDTTYNGGGDVFVTKLHLGAIAPPGRKTYFPLLRRS
jgi:hypothetical protein